MERSTVGSFSSGFSWSSLLRLSGPVRVFFITAGLSVAADVATRTDLRQDQTFPILQVDRGLAWRDLAVVIDEQERPSSDLRLNPHLHVLLLDGTYHEQGGELAWRELGRLSTQEVGEVLERAVRRIEISSRPPYARRGRRAGRASQRADALCASAVSGQTPPADPQWMRSLSAPVSSTLRYDKPRCASLDGFTLHAATRAGGGGDLLGREALLATCRVRRSPKSASN